MRISRVLSFFALGLIMACAGTTIKNVGFLNELEPQQVNAAKQVFASSRLMSYKNQCAADVFTSKNVEDGQGKSECEKNLGACVQRCLSGQGDDCFWAANAFQTTSQDYTQDLTDQVAYPLYMESCRLGERNACTNAGATAMNGSGCGDGGAPALAASDACQIRTYKIGCTNDASSWGCKMLRGHYPDEYAKHFKG